MKKNIIAILGRQNHMTVILADGTIKNIPYRKAGKHPQDLPLTVNASLCGTPRVQDFAQG